MENWKSLSVRPSQGRCRRVFFAVLGLASTTLEARTQRDRELAVSLTAARYAETYLRNVPLDLVTARLDFENSYFLSAGMIWVAARDFSILGMRRNSLELEGQLVQHFGGQDHIEATAAIALRTGELGLIGGTSVNAAAAIGLSYALRQPDFEYGPAYRGPAGGIRGLDSRQLQFYIGVEVEFSPSATSRFHFLGKLHHRSGGYGLISPQRTGSNFLGLGIRYDLRRANQR